MKYYRYEYTEYGNGTLSINELEYRLLRETNKGYWIIPDWSYSNEYLERWKKWIPKESRSRFAYPEKEKALLNFIKRTQRRKEILNSQIRSCEKALYRVGEMQSKGKLPDV